ncbi:hypothetical protein E05_42440 [Plautia stali symbiont]|nr:hypothetical protein E05_42440 [Plautia stali symbiont]
MRGFGNGEVEAQIRLRGQFGIVAVVHLYQRVKGIAQPLFIRLGGALRGVPGGAGLNRVARFKNIPAVVRIGGQQLANRLDDALF